MNFNGLGQVWKEAIGAWFEAIFYYLSEYTKEHHRNSVQIPGLQTTIQTQGFKSRSRSVNLITSKEDRNSPEWNL
jgi:hypothetical protein